MYVIIVFTVAFSSEIFTINNVDPDPKGLSTTFHQYL